MNKLNLPQVPPEEFTMLGNKDDTALDEDDTEEDVSSLPISLISLFLVILC